VIGKRDMDVDAVSVRVHGKGNLGARLRAEAVAEILQPVNERRG
jgi:threonyl-tRNA synthetase